MAGPLPTLTRALGEAATLEVTPPETPAVVCDALEGALMRSRIRESLFGDPVHDLRFGHFVIERPLGRGGMATVFVAADVRLQRSVALKLLTLDGPEDAAKRQRILEEARAAAAVEHDHVVRIFEVGHALAPDGARRAFIAMELLEGWSLRTWVREQAPRVSAIVDAYAQAARGLAAAHRAGIVHGDFKADNAMIDRRGHVRVLDFGLARVTGSSGVPTPAIFDATTPADSAPRGVAGTPAYMAPELFFGARSDARSDEWALCVSLYEALVGRLPFRSPASWREPPTWPSTLPRALVRVLARGLDPDPSRRHRDLDALAAALTRRPPRRAWRLAGVGLLLTGALGLLRGADDPCASIDLDDLPWHDDDGRAIRRAMTAVSPELAEDADVVVDALEHQANAWVEQARGRCRAGLSDDDGRVAAFDRCTRGRRAAFAAAVATLRDAGPREAAAARAWVLAWPQPTACEHEAIDSPRPLDAALLDAIEAEFDAARVELELGRTDLGPLQRLRERAAALDDGPTLAAIEADLGRAAVVVDDPEGGRALEHAHQLALVHGLDALATRVALDLALFHATHTLDLTQADRWLHAATSHGHLDDPANAGTRAAVGFAIAFARNDLEQAEAHATAALAAAGVACPAGCDATVAAQLDLARVAWQRDELGDALTWTRRADAIARAQLGRWHPHSGDAAYLMGRLLLDSGEVDAGVDVLEELLRTRQLTAGAGSATMISSRFALAQGWRAAGEIARADQALAQVIDDAHRIDLWSLEVLALSERSSLAAASGDVHGAVRLGERALALAEAGYGDAHPDVAMLQKNLAVQLGRVGRHDEALRLAERGWAMWKRASPSPSRQDAAHLQVLGTTQLALDRVDEAIATLRSCLELDGDGPIGRTGVRAHLALAEALGRRHDDAGAAAILTQARRRCAALSSTQKTAAECARLAPAAAAGDP